MTQLKPYTLFKLSSPIFCCLSVIEASVSPTQISLFPIYITYKQFTDPIQHNTKQYRVMLTQYHHVPTSFTKYQPVPPSTDPVPPNTNQYCLILNQYYHASTSFASYLPSHISYQPYCAILTQYNQVLLPHSVIGRCMSKLCGLPARAALSAAERPSVPTITTPY